MLQASVDGLLAFQRLISLSETMKQSTEKARSLGASGLRRLSDAPFSSDGWALALAFVLALYGLWL